MEKARLKDSFIWIKKESPQGRQALTLTIFPREENGGGKVKNYALWVTGREAPPPGRK